VPELRDQFDVSVEELVVIEPLVEDVWLETSVSNRVAPPGPETADVVLRDAG
jgi:hypothetical protein